MPISSPYSAASKPKRAPTKKELYTGGKVEYPEFTIFYNIAYFRIAGVISHLLGKSFDASKDSKDQLEKNLEPNRWKTNEKVLAGLNDYLFKGYTLAKNSYGYELTEKDKKMVVETIEKLIVIRNFHSHYYHDNSVLAFSKEIRDRIHCLRNEALDTLEKEYPKQIVKYEDTMRDFPLFNTVSNDEHFITKDGRTFFLSFFLTRGEMSRFLQQRKGYKRNDTPEFNIKHLVFRYYTHRDGAARKHYGQSENVLDTLSDADKNEILYARQAFKIISHLNDVPEISNDIKLFPLFLENKRVEAIDDYRSFCATHHLFQTLNIQPLIKKVKIKKEENQKNRNHKAEDAFEGKLFENYLNIGFEGYAFHLSKNTFHRLILDTLRRNDAGEIVMAQFQKFVSERNDFFDLINDQKSAENTLEEKDLTYTGDYYKFKLRNDFLKERMGRWIEKYEQEKKENLADEKFVDLIKTEPIEAGYYDFYFEADEKPRPADLFVKYAVQYLIDSEKVKDWYFMVEYFEIEERIKKISEYGVIVEKKFLVNERKIAYMNKIHEGARLALTPDGQIVIGFYTPSETTHKNSYVQEQDGKIKFIEGTPPKNKFLLGANALKNLMLAGHDNKNLNFSFFNPIIADLEKIRNAQDAVINYSDLRVLKNKKYLPQSFRLAMHIENLSTDNLKEQAQKRIKKLIEAFGEMAQPDAPKILRSEKNRQIMRCYKFFDWKYPNDNKFKFLRQDEYQRMSVYHFCLEKRQNCNLVIDSNNFLIKDILPHTPEIVKDLLRHSKSMDELFVNVIEKTINKLLCWKKKLDSSTNKELKEIFSKLGVSMHTDSEKLPDCLPFDIHPMVPLEIYYAEQLKAARKLTENESEKREAKNIKFSLSNEFLKNEILQKGLRTEHYDYKNYLEKIESSADAKKIKKHIIGSMNRALVQDTLLWQMAKFYLDKTSPAYKTFLLGSDSEQNWKVNNLRNTSIETKFGDNILTIKFHQLDDFLLIESTEVIQKAMAQVVKRFKYLKENPVPKKETQINISEIEQTDRYKIPYEEVFREIQRNFNAALNWAKHILEFEKDIVDAMSQTECDTLANNKGVGQSRRIDFKEVLSKVNFTNADIKKLLSEVRNKSFHAEIPTTEEFSYWEIENDQELGALLQYKRKIKHDYNK